MELQDLLAELAVFLEKRDKTLALLRRRVSGNQYSQEARSVMFLDNFNTSLTIRVLQAVDVVRRNGSSWASVMPLKTVVESATVPVSALIKSIAELSSQNTILASI